MGKVCEVDGFDVRVRSNDHPPPHVHVTKDGVSASFYIGDENTPPSEGPNQRMKQKHWNRAFQIVCEYQTECLAEWRRIHGSEDEEDG
jgi:hypothetical protein